MEQADTSDESPDRHSPGHQVPRNAAWRLAGSVTLALAWLAAFPIYTRCLGMEQWGLLSLFQAATAPLALLDLGIGTATVKYVAEALGRRDYDDARRVFHTTLLFNAVIGLAGAVVVFCLAPWFATSVFDIPAAQHVSATHGFRLVAINWFLGFIAATFTGVLVAHQAYDKVSRLNTLGAIANLIGGAGTALAGGSVVTVLAIQTLLSAATGILWVRAASRLLPGILRLPRWDEAAFRRSLSFGAWQSAAAAGGQLGWWSDRFLLGVFCGPAAVGIYAVAHGIETQIVAMFYQMAETLFPAVSALQGKGDLPAARRISLRAGWALSMSLGAALAVIGSIGGDFVQLWISPEAARRGTAVLRLLCLGGMAGMCIMGPYYFMLGIASTRWVAWTSLTGGLVTFLIGLALVPHFGLAGVAYGGIAGAVARWALLAAAWREAYSSDIPLADYSLHVWSPAFASAALLGLLTFLRGLVLVAPSWPFLFLEASAATLVAGAFQFIINELLPGGPERRRLLIGVFAPLRQRLDALLVR
jgi:O-antigen/teichoic acid export membrane protein